MPVKVSVGLSRKVGQPNFGSSGASCHVEFELDGTYDNGSTEHFQSAVRNAFTACRQAIESEIGEEQSVSPAIASGRVPAIVNRVAGQVNGSVNGSVRKATPNQVRAIFAITKSNCIELAGMLGTRFGVSRPEDLSISDASKLIEELIQNPANGAGATAS